MLRRKAEKPTSKPYADPRYEGKPMLALLEDYVRWSVGAMSAQRDASLQQLVPGLQKAFATEAPTWQGCVASGMQFPDTTPAALHDLYHQSGAAAAVADGAVDLTAWVQSVVDKNFT